MKLTIFGGSGRTGIHVIEQALEAGHHVTALVRTPSKLGVTHPNLNVIQGDIRDAAKIEQAVQGADAVISALGPTSNAPEFTVSNGMQHIINAMRKHAVQRLIISAGAGVGDPQDKPKPVDRLAGGLIRLFSKNVVADMTRAVTLVRESGLQWTVVRAPMLTDQPAVGSVRVAYLGGDIGIRLSRADFAAFMLQQLSDPRWVCQSPVISS